MRLPNNLLLAFILLLAGSTLARAAGPGEDTLFSLFRLHTASPSGHVAMAKAAGEAIAALPVGPYQSAARALLGWRLLQSGNPAEARSVYQSLLDDSATPPAFLELARRWLTRLDREEVRSALQKAWTGAIQYPDSLEALPKPLPPLQDRWGNAWRYRPGTLKRLKSEAQRYTLESPSLGADSDLAAALSRPWPKEPSLRAIALDTDSGATPIATFQTLKTPPEKILMTEGKSSAGVVLVKVGAHTLLLVEGDTVFLVPNPGK